MLVNTIYTDINLPFSSTQQTILYPSFAGIVGGVNILDPFGIVLVITVPSSNTKSIFIFSIGVVILSYFGLNIYPPLNQLNLRI